MITNLDRVNSVVQIRDTAKFLQEISTLGAKFLHKQEAVNHGCMWISFFFKLETL